MKTEYKKVKLIQIININYTSIEILLINITKIL